MAGRLGERRVVSIFPVVFAGAPAVRDHGYAWQLGRGLVGEVKIGGIGAIALHQVDMGRRRDGMGPFDIERLFSFPPSRWIYTYARIADVDDVAVLIVDRQDGGCAAEL